MGLPHGYGTLKQPEYTYIGYFKNGLKSGQGIIKQDNGTTITTEFDNDKCTQGQKDTPDYTYQGQLNEQFNQHGLGQQKFTNGSIYSGQFINGQFSGYGQLITKTYKYEGLFSQNKFNGAGIYTDLQTQTTYKGTFVNGYKQGEFIVTLPNKTEQKQIFNELIK